MVEAQTGLDSCVELEERSVQHKFSEAATAAAVG